MTPFAHAGHVLIDLALYGIPVLALILALAVSTARSRRSRSQGEMRGSRHPGAFAARGDANQRAEEFRAVN
jgi:hypothetical protein